MVSIVTPAARYVIVEGVEGVVPGADGSSAGGYLGFWL